MPRSDLSQIPARQRQLLAVLVAPVAAVLLLAGLLLGWQATSLVGHLIGTLVAVLALVLLGVAHGLFHSARTDEHERRLDEAVLAAAGPCGGDCGSCGVDDCAVKALPRL